MFQWAMGDSLVRVNVCRCVDVKGGGIGCGESTAPNLTTKTCFSGNLARLKEEEEEGGGGGWEGAR